MSIGALLYFPLVIANLAVLPFFVFLLATSFAAICARRKRHLHGDPTSRILIVVPAHNEEGGIAGTVRSCRHADYPPELFGVTVIADNCTDHTAAVANEAGARVVERFDAEKKSKGYAIEYLVDSLARSGELASLDALVIIDADTIIDAKLLRHFDQGLRAGHDWIQCYYTVANPDQSWRTRILTYAFSLYNGVLPLGQDTLGSSAGFKGNGMCFSTRGLARQPWRSYGLVEDMEFSWTLRLAGEHHQVRARRARLRHHAGLRRQRGGQPAPALGVRPQRSSPQVPAAAPRVDCNGLARQDDLVVRALAAANDLAGDRLWRADGRRLGRAGVFRRRSIERCRAHSVRVHGHDDGCARRVRGRALLALKLPWRYAASVAFWPFYAAWKLLVLLSGPPRQWVRTARRAAVVGARRARTHRFDWRLRSGEENVILARSRVQPHDQTAQGIGSIGSNLVVTWYGVLVAQA